MADLLARSGGYVRAVFGRELLEHSFVYSNRNYPSIYSFAAISINQSI